MICDTYYGGFRTRTFADIFPSFEAFEEEYKESPLLIEFNEYLSMKNLYFMLYAHYGNSHISFSDENQFKFYLYSIIYQYGPSVIKRREIQIKLTKLSDAELQAGGKAIYNHSYNPSSEPGTGTLEELLTINDQNTTNHKRSLIEGYAYLNDILTRDLVDDFIHKFKRLFIQVLAPDYPLLYLTEVEND